MKKFLAMLCAAVLLIGCGKGNTIPDKEGVMCEASHHNWGECDFSSDIWTMTTFYVEYSGNMRIVDSYNLSGDQERTVQLEEEDLQALYKILTHMKYKDTSSAGCDGSVWKISLEDEEKFYGYTGGGKENDVIDILLKY